MSADPRESDVSVLGLGSMGTAIAGWLMKQGKSVTVWNRTRSRAEVLLSRGARWIDTPVAALEANPLVFTIVDSYQTIGTWIESCRSLGGTTLVNITTGTPDEARALEFAVIQKGGRFLDAALFCYPDAVGSPDSAARFSGSSRAWTEYGHELETIGGESEYLGERVELANAVDGAWISFYVPALVAALEAAAFAASYDVPFDVARRAVSTALPVINSFLRQSAERLRTDNFCSENPVSLYENALTTVISPAAAQGLPAVMSRAAMEMMRNVTDQERDGMDISVLVRHLLSSGRRGSG